MALTTEEKVRLLIGDLNSNNYFFTADQIAQFLINKSNNIKLAAAQGLYVVAANLARKADLTIGKYSKKAAIAELRKLAKKLEEDAELEGVDADGNEIFYIGYVEKVQTEFNAAEIINNVAIRTELGIE